MTQEPLVSHGLLIVAALRSHSDTPHSLGLPWTSDQPDTGNSLPDNTQHSKQTNTNAFGEI